MRGSRWGIGALLAGVLVLAALPLDWLAMGAAQSAPAPAGTTLIGTSGTTGSFSIGYAVGVCRQSGSGDAWQVEADVPSPQTVTALPATAGQRIAWEPRLYQQYPDSQFPHLVYSGMVQTKDVAAGASTSFAKETFTGLAEGPRWVAGGLLTWLVGEQVLGTYEFIYINHDSSVNGRLGSYTGGCPPAMGPAIALSTYRTTVNVTVRISGRYFPVSAPVQITWNGKTLATVMSDAQGWVSGSIRVPATPLGNYAVGLTAGSWWKTAATLTVVPRVKVIPDTAARGETVKISLRGFAKREEVRIRWKQGNRWVEIGRVTTSNTGSGHLYIPVPSWVPDGQSSVRGDGPIARAQTNAVWISGGTLISLASEPSPTPSPTATPDASPAPDLTATTEPGLTATAEPSETPTTPAPTGTPQPTETATETPTEPAAPSETATVLPTESPPADTTPGAADEPDGP